MKKLFENKSVLVSIKLLISGLLIYLIIDYVDSKNILTNLKSINLIYFSFALLLVPLNIFVQFRKWYLISDKVLQIKNSKIIKHSLYQGFSAGIVTPFRAGEYLARNIALKSNTSKVALATFVDKIFNMFIILVVGIIALILLFIRIKNTTLISGTLVFGAIITFISILLTKTKLITKLINHKYIKSNRLVILIGEYKSFNPKFYVKLLLYSGLHYFLILMQYSFILISLNSHDSFLKLFWFVSLLLFGKTIIPPFTFGELGIREASSIFFSKYFLITKAIAFNSTVIIFLINLLLPALWGMLYLYKDE